MDLALVKRTAFRSPFLLPSYHGSVEYPLMGRFSPTIRCMSGTFVLACLLSCVAEKTVSTQIETDRFDNQKTSLMEKRINSLFSGDSTVVGKNDLKVDKRSAFENNIFSSNKDGLERKSFDKKEYSGLPASYEKKNWDSTKAYNEGKMDSSDFSNRTASVSKDSVPWQNQAHETSQFADRDKTWLTTKDKYLERKEDTYTTGRREQLNRPRIISSQDQQMKTIEEVKNLLGRD